MPAGLSRALPWAWTVAEWEGLVRPRGLIVPFLPKCPLGAVAGGQGMEPRQRRCFWAPGSYDSHLGEAGKQECQLVSSES